MSKRDIKGLPLLGEYDKFVCKAIYIGSDITEFMVYNDFIIKMYNTSSEVTEKLIKKSGINDCDKDTVIDFCKGNTRLSSCRNILSEFFSVLSGNQDMLNHMLDLKKDNDVCLYMLTDVSRDIKDKLVELNIGTATELTKYLLTTKTKPFGISARSMYKLFESIRAVSEDYDVQYIKQCYESITSRAEYEKTIQIDFYRGISIYDLYLLYTICRHVNIYNINDAIAIVYAFRHYINEDMVGALLNCYGRIIPNDVKEFIKSMSKIDKYIESKKGMRLSQFQSLVVRSAYHVSKILDGKKIREILISENYGIDKLCLDNINKDKEKILIERIPNLNVFEFQEYIRKNARLPVDLTIEELKLLFTGNEMKKYEKWFNTFIVEKDGYPVYVLS